MKLSSVLTALVLALGLSAARADSFLEIIHATEQRTTTASHAVLGADSTFVVGRLRSLLDLEPGQQAFISFTFEGSSTIGTDAFEIAGSRLSTSVTPGTSLEVRLDPGLLDFGFSRGAVQVVSNADNASWLDANFGIVLDAGGRSGRLLFEDARLGSDFDYDDMVLRFQMRLTPVAPVPEPSSIGLAAAGIGLLVWVRRRRM